MYCNKYNCQRAFDNEVKILSDHVAEQLIDSTVLCCVFRVREVAELSTTVPLKTQTYWTIGMMLKDTTVRFVTLIDF